MPQNGLSLTRSLHTARASAKKTCGRGWSGPHVDEGDWGGGRSERRLREALAVRRPQLVAKEAGGVDDGVARLDARRRRVSTCRL